MLKRRVTKPFEAVCMADPALDKVPEERMKRYQISRNIEDLKLKELTAKPTIFHCFPLSPRYDHLTNDFDEGSLWEIFRHHVAKIDNFDFGSLNVFEAGDGRPRIKEDAKEVFPPEAIQEIGAVIRLAPSRMDSRPFFSEDTWLRERKRRKLQNAASVAIDTVNDIISQ